MIRIEKLTSESAETDALADLLCETVNGGAAVGFLPPLSVDEARQYWMEVIGLLDGGNRLLFGAFDGVALVGTVQLDLITRTNSLHRTEVMKMMVHPDARRKGIGRLLMLAVEEAARRADRTLLVLDTREGDPSERLYQSAGYTRAGRIPNYARSANGEMHATVIYYRELTAGGSSLPHSR